MTKIVSCDCKIFYNVKKKWDESGNVARRLGTGLVKPMRSASFLEALDGEITNDPSKSMHALTKEAGYDEKIDDPECNPQGLWVEVLYQERMPAPDNSIKGV